MRGMRRRSLCGLHLFCGLRRSRGLCGLRRACRCRGLSRMRLLRLLCERRGARYGRALYDRVCRRRRRLCVGSICRRLLRSRTAGTVDVGSAPSNARRALRFACGRRGLARRRRFCRRRSRTRNGRARNGGLMCDSRLARSRSALFIVFIHNKISLTVGLRKTIT